MHFPVDDVVKNVRHFLTAVKRITGNSKEAEIQKSKNQAAKPGERPASTSSLQDLTYTSHNYQQGDAQLSTRSRDPIIRLVAYSQEWRLKLAQT